MCIQEVCVEDMYRRLELRPFPAAADSCVNRALSRKAAF